MVTELAGLALLLTGDRTAAGDLVHTALTRAHSDRKPDEQAVIAAVARAWLSGGQPVGEPPELPDDLELARRSLEALSEHQRLTVVLHHWSGLTVPEIARMLRRPEGAVAADLAAGVAELFLPVPTVAASLAALVTATGPVPVDLEQVRTAARTHRRRTAILAAGVLVAAGLGAVLLAPGEPEPVSSRDTPVRVVSSYGGAPQVVDVRALVLTAQLHSADVLPDTVTPPPRFATNDDQVGAYSAVTRTGSTSLYFFVAEDHDTAASIPHCPEPITGCTTREFPDGTVATVAAMEFSGSEAPPNLSLTSIRPDGTILYLNAVTDGIPGPLEVDEEDLFRFATVFTY